MQYGATRQKTRRIATFPENSKVRCLETTQAVKQPSEVKVSPRRHHLLPKVAFLLAIHYYLTALQVYYIFLN